MSGNIVLDFLFVCMFICMFIFPSTGSKFLRQSCVRIYMLKIPLMNFIHIGHDGYYRSNVLLKVIPTFHCDLEAKVTNLSFAYKVMLLYIVLSRPFNKFHLCLV